MANPTKPCANPNCSRTHNNPKFCSKACSRYVYKRNQKGVKRFRELPESSFTSTLAENFNTLFGE